MVDDRAHHGGLHRQLPDAQHSGVAAPTVLQDLHITTQQTRGLSRLPGRHHGAAHLRYVLDVIGLKTGFAIFAIAWSLISMSHCFANSCKPSRGCGITGFAEGSSNPAGMKATSSGSPQRSADLPAACTISALPSAPWSRRRLWLGNLKL